MRTSAKQPTAVKEDYLRALWRLQEKGEGEVRLVDIATYLGLSRSTVSERVRALAEEGYVTHSHYGQIAFTRRGYALGKKLTHKHRVIEVFLHDVLKVPARAVHAEAHALEHALSDDVTRRLGKWLGNPQTDPHGVRIPTL